MIIDIPLNGGLRTFADSEQIGNDGCTVLKNIDIHIPGKFQTRTIFGDKATISDNVKAIIRWLAPDGNIYWVIRTDNTLHLTTDLTNLGTDYSGSSTGLEIANYGDYLRFFGDLTKRPQTLHYYPSSRKHFWSMDSNIFTAGFSMSEGIPALDSRFNFTVSSEPSSVSTINFPFGNLDLENETYYYKIAPVFDGVQEGLMSEILADTSTVSSTNDSTGVIQSIFTFRNVNTTFDNRLTALNFYRATESGGPYYKLLTASCLGDTDPSLTKVTDGIVGIVIYDEDGNFTSADSSSVLTPADTDVVSTAVVTDITNTANIGIANSGVNANYLKLDSAFNTTIWNEPYWILRNISDSIIQSFSFDSGVENWTVSNTWTSNDGSGSASINSVSGGQTNNCLEASLINTDNVTGDVFIVMSSPEIVLANNTKSSAIHISGYVKRDSGTPINSSTSLGYQIYDGSNWSGITYIGHSTSVAWTLLQDTINAYGATKIKLIVRCSHTSMPSGDTFKVLADTIQITRKYQIVKQSTGYSGKDVLFSPSLSLDRTDGKRGSMVHLYKDVGVYSLNRTFTAVKANTDKAVQFTSEIGYTDESVEMHLDKNYLWRKHSSNRFDIIFNDHGLNDGISHPLEGLSDISVNYKHCQFLDGRKYVGNVKFPNANNETHKNWVIYSELNQPDVLPVSNFIEIQDSQGGEIVGLGRMLGDLVIFMEKGIYRLHTPSTDPGSWSLIESEENIGCVASDSIIEVEGVLYFAGKDHIYGLDANFQAVPITKNIQNVWQETLNQENTKITYDPKLKRLLCQFGGSNTSAYLFHLGTGEWSQWEYTGSLKSDLILVDEDLNINLIQDSGTSLIYDDNVSTNYSSVNSEIAVGITRETGWIKLTDNQDDKIIRRLNVKYSATIVNNYNQPIVFTIYVDGNSNSVWTKTITETSSVFNKIESLRVSRRAKNFQLKIEATSSGNTSGADQNIVSIERLGVEVD